jgi:uncharacterized protein DUF6893
MSRLTSKQQALLSRRRGRHEEEYDLAEREHSRGRVSGWLIAGLVVAGLGALAFYYLGPDLRRYIKIEKM